MQSCFPDTWFNVILGCWTVHRIYIHSLMHVLILLSIIIMQCMLRRHHLLCVHLHCTIAQHQRTQVTNETQTTTLKPTIGGIRNWIFTRRAIAQGFWGTEGSRGKAPVGVWWTKFTRRWRSLIADIVYRWWLPKQSKFENFDSSPDSLPLCFRMRGG